MTDPIRAAIEASRERESKATPGEWSTLGEENEVHAIEFVDGAGDPLHIAELIHFPPNAAFIAAARTYEPRFRDALEMAVYLIKKSCIPEGHERGRICLYCQYIERLAAILEGKP